MQGAYCVLWYIAKTYSRARVMATIVALSVPPRPPRRASAQRGSFDWRRQWYPIAVVDKGCTDPSRPHRAKLLGEDLVLWFDSKDARWRCFEDACPHRRAPLSEGRVERDGTLLCAYHAWRFDGSGTCASIPQMRDDSRATSCPRARARAFATREDHGLLWVWACPDEDPGSTMPRTMPELAPEKIARGETLMPNTWVQRDLPYGWDFFYENTTDGSHGPVSHHKILGDRYTDALPIVYDTIVPLSDADGFETRWNNTASKFQWAETNVSKAAFTRFYPPCLLRVENTQSGGSNSILALYATPTSPGRCRFFGANILVRGPDGAMPQGFAFNLAPMPVWLGHTLASLVLHQDLVFLHRQQAILDGQDWTRACYMPASADKATRLFRVWFARNGPIPWAKDDTLPPVEEDPRALFDVYHSHTKSCVHCSRALRRFEAARNVLALAAGMSSTYGMTIALASAALAAHAISRFFYVYEYSHQDNE